MIDKSFRVAHPTRAGAVDVVPVSVAVAAVEAMRQRCAEIARRAAEEGYGGMYETAARDILREILGES